VQIFARDSKDPLLVDGRDDRLYVEGDGAPFEPGEGKIAIRVMHIDAQQTRTPGRVEVEQIWPHQIDRKYVVGMKYTGFPVDTFSRDIEDLLTTLSDQAKSLPFRPLNIQEREKAVRYDKVFTKDLCRKTHANDYIIGHITGNAYSIDAVVKAAGGVSGSLTQFMHGERNPTDHRPKVPTFYEMRQRYIRLYNDVLREGGWKIQKSDLVQDPFPSKAHQLIKAIEQGTLGEPRIPILHQAVAFRPINKTSGNAVQSAKRGYSCIIPNKTAAESIRSLVARNEGTIEDPIPKTKFIAPEMNTGTTSAADNVANAIIELASDRETQDPATLRRFIDRAKENGAEGGNGLFPTNMPDKEGKHTAFSQAAKIVMSTVVGLVFHNDADVNCVFIEGKQCSIVGRALTANTIVATFSGKKMHLDHLCCIRMCPKVAAEIPPCNPAVIKYGPDDASSGTDRSTLDSALAKRGLVRPYLTKTVQGTAIRAILYDTCYALLGRPTSFNGADIQSLVNAALPVANQKVSDDDVISSDEDAITRVFLTAANVIRAAAGQIAFGELKEGTRRIIANILSTDQVIFFRADTSTHEHQLDDAVKGARNAVCMRTIDSALNNEVDGNAQNQKTNIARFGRRFATEEHVNTAFFAHDSDIAKRTAIATGTPAAKRDTGHKYTTQEARKLLQSCTPLHQLTPEMHAAFLRHADE